MKLEDFLTNYISELLCAEDVSLLYAYSQVEAVPRLKVPILLYLAVTKEHFTLSLVDTQELKTVSELLETPNSLPSEYKKLLEYYNYLSSKHQKRKDLVSRLKAAVNEQMQLKSITAEQVCGLVMTEHTMSQFTMQEYSRALHLLKIM